MAKTEKHLTIEEAAEAGQAMEAMHKPPPSPPVTLWQKIAAAMKAVGYVQKRGWNQFHKYSYATASDVAEEAREAFLEVGLLFLPTVKAVETREKATSKGGITYITRVTMTYRVMSTTPEESFYEFEMVGEGQDEGDKSVFKAITGAHKYALMQLLCVSTGDDPEADVKTDETKPVEPTITDEQVLILEQAIEATGADLVKMLSFFHVERLAQLTAAQYERAKALLAKKIP